MKQLTCGERAVRCLLGEPTDRVPYGVGIGWGPWGVTCLQRLSLPYQASVARYAASVEYLPSTFSSILQTAATSYGSMS